MLRKPGGASCIPALAYNPARSMNCGSNAHSYRNSFYGVSSGSSRSACTDLLCKGVDKKGCGCPRPEFREETPKKCVTAISCCTAAYNEPSSTFKGSVARTVDRVERGHQDS